MTGLASNFFYLFGGTIKFILDRIQTQFVLVRVLSFRDVIWPHISGWTAASLWPVASLSEDILVSHWKHGQEAASPGELSKQKAKDAAQITNPFWKKRHLCDLLCRVIVLVCWATHRLFKECQTPDIHVYQIFPFNIKPGVRQGMYQILPQVIKSEIKHDEKSIFSLELLCLFKLNSLKCVYYRFLAWAHHAEI